MTLIASRVHRRWLQRLADQAPGQRKKVRELSHPINIPKGIDAELRGEHGDVSIEGEDVVTPDRKDIEVKDVFFPDRNNQGVQNLADSGRDFSQKQVEGDKGFAVVKNLAQYLIRTDGGSEGGPEGKKL